MMKTEKLSETISPDGTALPGVKDLALDYLLLDEEHDRGDISTGLYEKRRDKLLETVAEMYGDGLALYDWMREQNISCTDNTFFAGAVNVSRLKDVGEFTTDNGLIVFTEPENERFRSDVAKLQDMGLSYIEARSVRRAKGVHIIVMNEKHPLLTLNGATFNLYRPKTLREVSAVWDKVRAGIER